ncbi:MAG: glycosyltransferase family 9 protein [Bdellovibrionaceae bacterium]|nr:glycosyltransferase family 9 protein [Pseudobdellovibrionaceae bacterium]NUM57882.1 glycosyltransferase family 9 protein [Pseudobdellovibrionaceae bacterium]
MQSNSHHKILIIRFSSFGDITQCLSVIDKLKEKFKDCDIDWATRQEFKELISHHPNLTNVICLDRKSGLKGLFKMAFLIREQNYTHIYDAHNNFRSNLILTVAAFFKKMTILKRPTYRWKRFLLFKLRINKYKQPFSGQRDLLEPLLAWGINSESPNPPQVFYSRDHELQAKEKLKSVPETYITMAPSAAFFLKRWPKAYWKQLIEHCKDDFFVLLGGPDDQFIEDIIKDFPGRTLNLAGKCSLSENIPIIKGSKMLISNDTGLMHIAEQLGHPCVALMGPAPFGFPSRSTTKILQLDLKCRPCSKHGQGPCVNSKYHQCLVDILPEQVARLVIHGIN